MSAPTEFHGMPRMRCDAVLYKIVLNLALAADFSAQLAGLKIGVGV